LSKAVATKPMTRRALNRALLARQLLLKRERLQPLAVIERLAGMQAQVPRPPFVGLWTRLQKFDPASLLALARSRKVVRATAMRGTIHLLSAKDFLSFRPLLSATLARGAWAIAGKRLGAVDVKPFYEVGRAFFGKNEAPFEDLRGALERKFPNRDVRAMAYVVRMGIPLVMVPTDDDRWGWPANAAFTLADTWLGKRTPLDPPPIESMVRRYLAAFGPATPGDAQTWSGIPGMREVFERLRPKLVTFRDDRKRELFDLPDAPRPDENTPAPVRFLPEYDNVVLSHDDRTRIIANEHRGELILKNLVVVGSFTVDGFIAGTWKVEVKVKKEAALTLTPFAALPKKAGAEVVAEAERLLEFLEPDNPKRTVKLTRA